MKRFISVFLSLLMVLVLFEPMPSNAALRPGEVSFFDCTNSYVLPFVTMDQKGAVLGQSTTIQFYAHIVDKDVKYLRIYIKSPHQYRPVEEFRIPIKQGCYNYSWTWSVPKDKYSVGSYLLGAFLTDSYGNTRSTTNSINLNVVPSSVPAAALDLRNGSIKAENITLTLYTYSDYAIIHSQFSPLNSTSDRSVSYTSSDPKVVKIAEQGAGYIYLSARSPGTATITATCGKLTSSFTVRVKTVDSVYFDRINESIMTFCPGRSFMLFTKAPGFDYVGCSWSISDPSVVCVKKDDPFQDDYNQNYFLSFLCLKPGTAVITANNGGKTASVEIRVQEHEPVENIQRTEPTCTTDGLITGICGICNKSVSVVLPATGHQLGEDAVRIEPTATQPGSLTGKCTVCGEEGASLVIPAIFSDTKPDAWYAEHVDKVYDLKLMNGTGTNTFAPNANVTRAMAATVLYRMAGEPAEPYQSTFLDVPLRSYYTSAVIWAENNGIVNGYPDGTFRPGDNITREQLATILYRYAKAEGKAQTEPAGLSGFPDVGKVHSYATEAMAWAVGAELINGVGSNGKTYLQPANNATRAQFATIISRYLSNTIPIDDPVPEPSDHDVPESPTGGSGSGSFDET